MDIADRLHSVSIHLLRRLRRVDSATGLSGPRLSALSVVVFAGPVTLGDLAAAEQVAAPTMTRLVQALERDGYLRREADPLDGRAVRLQATPRGRKILKEGRLNRVKAVAALLGMLDSNDQKSVRRAVSALETVVAGRRSEAV